MDEKSETLEGSEPRDLSCKQAARLMSVRRDRTLDPAEEIDLRQHLTVCMNCRRFDGQLDVLSELAKRYAAAKAGDIDLDSADLPT